MLSASCLTSSGVNRSSVFTVSLGFIVRDFAALVHESELTRNDPSSPCRLPPDRVRRWPATLNHLIEDVACEHGLSPLSRRTARVKAIPDDRLVSEEGVLHTGLAMVARRSFSTV